MRTRIISTKNIKYINEAISIIQLKLISCNGNVSITKTSTNGFINRCPLRFDNWCVLVLVSFSYEIRKLNAATEVSNLFVHKIFIELLL